MHVTTQHQQRQWYFDNSWWQLQTMGSAAPVGVVVVLAQVKGYDSNNNCVLTQNYQTWETTIFFGNFVEMTIIFGNFVKAFL